MNCQCLHSPSLDLEIYIAPMSWNQILSVNSIELGDLGKKAYLAWFIHLHKKPPRCHPSARSSILQPDLRFLSNSYNTAVRHTIGISRRPSTSSSHQQRCIPKSLDELQALFSSVHVFTRCYSGVITEAYFLFYLLRILLAVRVATERPGQGISWP